VDWPQVLRSAGKLSFAEAVRIADDAAKERIIEQQPRITTELLLRSIADRVKATQPGKKPRT
jgi:hypothetical protein